MTDDWGELTRMAEIDLFDGRCDPANARLVESLGAYHRRVNPARWLPETPHEFDPRIGPHLQAGDGARRQGWLQHWRSVWILGRVQRNRRRVSPPVRVGLLALCIAVLCGGIVVAASNILDLGKPTNTQSTNAYFPLGAFHHLRKRHGASLPTGVTFFYSLRSEEDEVEEWPLLKALEQFGVPRGIRVTAQHCSPFPMRPPAPPVQVCDPPTFDLSRAKFTSHHISARFVRLTNQHGLCAVGNLSTADWSVLVSYGGASPKNRARFCKEWDAPLGTPGFTFRSPVLFVGSYVQSGIELVHPGDFEQAVPSTATTTNTVGSVPPLTGLSFATVQSALAAGQNPPGNTSLVQDVNAEANVITAFICHADGSKPKSVCSRPVIRQMLRHIK